MKIKNSRMTVLGCIASWILWQMIQNQFVKLNIILEYTYFTLYYIDIDTYTWTETKHVFQFSICNYWRKMNWMELMSTIF